MISIHKPTERTRKYPLMTDNRSLMSERKSQPPEILFIRPFTSVMKKGVFLFEKCHHRILCSVIIVLFLLLSLIRSTY